MRIGTRGRRAELQHVTRERRTACLPSALPASAKLHAIASQTVHPRRRRCRDDAATGEEAAHAHAPAAEPPGLSGERRCLRSDDRNIHRDHGRAVRGAQRPRPGPLQLGAARPSSSGRGATTSRRRLGTIRPRSRDSAPARTTSSSRRARHLRRRDGPAAGGSFDTFWRSGDNFRHEANRLPLGREPKAAPLRRIHAARDLELFDPTARVNYASGGYLGNSIVEGNSVLGSQQQWISRNVQMNGATGGAWSNVYVGCAGAVPEPSAAGAEPRVSVVDQAPVVAAKPYIVIGGVGRYAFARAARGQGRRRRGA